MNILLIFADQMHKYALGCVSEEVVTPHLDQLHREGVLFTQAYSNNPICGPFRGNLLTGQYASTNGVERNGDRLPETVPSLAEAFSSHGYATSFVGKWHLGGKANAAIPHELRGGFERFCGYQCYNGFWDNVCLRDDNDEEVCFAAHRTEVETDLAEERMRELHAQGRPWFQLLAYQAPHYPVQPPQAYYELYRNHVFTLGPDYEEVDPYTSTQSPRSPRPIEHCPDYQRYGGDMQEYLRLYYGMVSHLDACIGRLLAALEELGIREDTAIVFTADHGDMQGSHGLKNKTLPYEKSSGIPLIASVPDGPKNVTSDAVVSGIDLYPTLLDAAGLPTPAHVEGCSFAPLLRADPAAVPPDTIFVEHTGRQPWKMIRSGAYKLTVDWETGQPTQLYNVRDDPYELDNLIDRPAYALGQQALLARLRAQFRSAAPPHA